MSHASTEDQLGEQPAIELFRSLDWQVILPKSAAGEVHGASLLRPRLLSGLAAPFKASLTR